MPKKKTFNLVYLTLGFSFLAMMFSFFSMFTGETKVRTQTGEKISQAEGIVYLSNRQEHLINLLSK